jgi:hypothetical protein
MRWPWSRPRGGPSPEAIDAAREATRGLQDAKAMHAKAERSADALSATARQNHFAEAVKAAMRRT